MQRGPWEGYRLWNRLGIGAVLAAFPLALASTALSDRVEGLSMLPSLVILAAVVVFGAALIYHAIFSCPRCGKNFSQKHLFGLTSTGRKCVHCGLRLYADV